MRSFQPARDTSVSSVSDECSSNISSIYFEAVAWFHMPAHIECDNVAKFQTMQHFRTRLCGRVLERARGEAQQPTEAYPSVHVDMEHVGLCVGQTN